MGIEIRLEWYDKKTEALESNEYANFGEDDSLLVALGLDKEPEIFDGGYDICSTWIAVIQPHFQHRIDPNCFDYQISFRYRKDH
jgi:hypothetical protein